MFKHILGVLGPLVFVKIAENCFRRDGEKSRLVKIRLLSQNGTEKSFTNKFKPSHVLKVTIKTFYGTISMGIVDV